MKKKRLLSWLCLVPLLFAACRKDEIVVPAEYELLPLPVRTEAGFAPDEPIGMYLLNEGNMGSNKASIDYVDFVNGCYVRNIYAGRNPSVVKELGDVGNDIQVYGSKLYAVINCSHKVEVMDARTCVRVGQIDIPNCRYIRFSCGKAYVSAYVGPVSMDPDAQPGAVFEIDTATLSVTGQVTVGYQPDELDISGEYVYVANSGGYRAPDYDHTVSVVERQAMRQVCKIAVGPNLNGLRKDRYGRLWVSSHGDYGKRPSRLYLLAEKDGLSREMAVSDTFDLPCHRFTIAGDSLYYCGLSRTGPDEADRVSYGIVDVRTMQHAASFITDGTEREIKTPYGIAVNPYDGDIFVTDARNYVSSGVLHCYGKDGKRKWSVRTGDIPAHMVFIYKKNG